MTIREAAEKVFDASRTSYDEGCPVIGNDVELIGFTETTPKKYSGEELAVMEQSALKAAKEADLVVMPLGEHYLQFLFLIVEQDGGRARYKAQEQKRRGGRSGQQKIKRLARSRLKNLSLRGVNDVAVLVLERRMYR